MTSSWDDVTSTLHEKSLRFTDVDRIEVSQETYNDFVERQDTTIVADYETADAPAVRVTAGTERVVLVDKQGKETSYDLG